MKSTLPDLYRSIDKSIRTLYVFPRIPLSSIWNPYLSLLYKDFLVPENNTTGIICKSPHPLLPVFIIKRLFGERSVVHYHWLEFSDIPGFIILLWKLFLLLTYRAVGGKIVWTIHNRRPHRNKYALLNSLFYRVMAKLAQKIHVHNNEAVQSMAQILYVQEDKFYVIEHPRYPVTLIKKEKAINWLRQNMRIPLDNTKPLFLMYGFIAPYKGTALAVQACIKNNLQLIVAGECLKGEEAYLKYIKALINNNKNTSLRQDFLSAEDEMYLFNAADCVVFNFKDILSSGSVILAQCYKKDIILPDVGCLKEMEGDDIFKFTTTDELEQQLIAYSKSTVKKGL